MHRHSLPIAGLPLFFLFMGFISTLGGAVWTLLYTYHLKQTSLSYCHALGQGIEELTLSAVLHILFAVAVYLDIRRRENP